jgi:predicted transposase/invertase (TIGR01784 family)
MPELLLGDGTKKIFVNPYGSKEGLPEEVERLLNYIRDNQPTDYFTEELNHAVAKARDHKEWEVEYMNWRAYEMDINIDKRIAREEGLAEGRTQGLAEGRKDRDKSLIMRWLQKGKTISEIAEDLDQSEEYVRKLMQ